MRATLPEDPHGPIPTPPQYSGTVFTVLNATNAAYAACEDPDVGMAHSGRYVSIFLHI